MTEEEAKTKPCIGPSPSNTGTVHENVPNYVCRGSACMAWRWLGKSNERYITEQTGTVITFKPVPIEAGDGYCGYAGKP